MNNYKDVEAQVASWKAAGLPKAEIVSRAASACLGWPYVWGGSGQLCTVANRKEYMARGSIPAADAAKIRDRCPVLKGSRGSCNGCSYYPGEKTRFFDCRGFTRWLLGQAGISLEGAGATSQWNKASNWTEKGDIRSMPDTVCCVFMQEGSVMEHTGMHVGGGVVIHCSGEVKKGKTTDRGWTHYAVPKGLSGAVPPAPGPEPSPSPTPSPSRPTLRRGSKGDAVSLCQSLLLSLGYDLGAYGADGKFGAKTEKAVKAFQRDRGLAADGIVGPKTWAALEAEPAPGPAPAPGEKRYTVTVRHLTAEESEALMMDWPDTIRTEEKEA